jgi:two-component system, OmpR family, sensor kinase
MSLRLRLTILYSAILAATLTLFGLLLYLTLARVTIDLVEQTLEAEAIRLTQVASFQLNRVTLPASRFPTPEIYLQTRNMQGEILGQSFAIEGFILPLSSSELAKIQQSSATRTIFQAEQQRFALYSAPVLVRNVPIGIIQVARSLAEQEQALASLRQLLLVGGVVVTLISFGIGWLLAGLALRPIKRIALTAEAIGQQRDFSERVVHRGPHDEIGRLAATFNQMLGELQDAYQQISTSLQAQRRFVADASHELRTPLTTIRGNLELLQRQPPIAADDRVAVLADLTDETERLMRLVNQLLLLARAEARQLPATCFPLNPLIEAACRQAQILAPDRTINFLPVQSLDVLANEDSLRQVLLILLHNAIIHTPASAAIQLITKPHAAMAEICVIDTGPGIASHVLPHIFERFSRGDLARQAPGSGLGLPIAKALLEAMGGTIHVESTPGKGTTFTICIPSSNSR